MSIKAQDGVDDDHTEAYYLDADSYASDRAVAYPDAAAVELTAAAVGYGALTAIDYGYYRACPVVFVVVFAGLLVQMGLWSLYRGCLNK